MADLKKFLNSEGVGHLWTRVTEKIAADVAVEKARAEAEELKNKNAAAAAQSAVDALAGKVGTVAEGSTVVGMIGAVQGEVDAVEVDLGNVDNLSTENKTVVGAINEVLTAVGTGGTNAVVTIDTTTTTDGALKSYTIKQGGTLVGTIDIPKDMVVESGEVVVDPAGQAAGTYIKLKLANVTEPLFINVGTLVDIYTAKADATQVQVTIDPSTREISAAIVAGSVTATELAANAVTTEKIADANVTKAKLSTEVQGLLDNAATEADLTLAENRIAALEAKHGTGEGTVEAQIAAAKQAAIDAAAADATTKANAAETNAKNASDAKGSAAQALADAKAYADGLAGNYDAAGSAAQALTDAKAYTDTEINTKVIALTNSEIDTAIGYVQA